MTETRFIDLKPEMYLDSDNRFKAPLSVRTRAFSGSAVWLLTMDIPI